MFGTEEVNVSMSTQVPEENVASTAEGENSPPAPKKSRPRSKKAPTSLPLANIVPASSQDVTLDALELIEEDKEFFLNELKLYEIRERNKKIINSYVVQRSISEPPSITIIQLEDGTFLVVDGATRFIAASLDGAKTIKGNVYKGTLAQAKVLALKLNQHGEKLSQADIKRQIDRIDEEHKGAPLSSRDMAKLVGTSHTTVAAHRATRGQSDLESIQNMRRDKTPEEKRAAMVQNVLKMVGNQGDEVLDDIVAALPLALRMELIGRLVAKYSSGS